MHHYRVDVSGFGPNELKVDVKGDDIIVVGEHKSDTHHEAVERSFSRCVRIPKGIHKESIECHVNKKGHLNIEGKKPLSMFISPKVIFFILLLVLFASDACNSKCWPFCGSKNSCTSWQDCPPLHTCQAKVGERRGKCVPTT
uniref:SHSP domain-containing protein n=1 Tax=Ditylenchus dipsaci TaxID=166011 RepID=A0A915EX28_9BILA